MKYKPFFIFHESKAHDATNDIREDGFEFDEDGCVGDFIFKYNP